MSIKILSIGLASLVSVCVTPPLFAKTLNFADGSRYSGSVRSGVPHGQGEIYFPDASNYKGTFQYGKISGVGVMSLPDGSLYRGELVNGSAYGSGELLFSIDSRYVHPDCKSPHKKTRPKLVGLFKNGVLLSPAQFFDSAGCVYEGSISYNLPSGNGRIIQQDGSIIHGFFSDGRRIHALDSSYPNRYLSKELTRALPSSTSKMLSLIDSTPRLDSTSFEVDSTWERLPVASSAFYHHKKHIQFNDSKFTTTVYEDRTQNAFQAHSQIYWLLSGDCTASTLRAAPRKVIFSDGLRTLSKVSSTALLVHFCEKSTRHLLSAP